jgi:transcriptional regulator
LLSIETRVMYVPKYYKIDSPDEVRDFINANGFATLISQVESRLWATHIPLLLDTGQQGKEILTGHLSRANRQWKNFNNNDEVLAVFMGPDAYISSSWYDHENVPTWNYMAVHVYGRIRIVEGELLKEQLGKMVDKYEAGLENPVNLKTMSKEYLEQEIKGLVGFEIEISEIQAASKLSQNRDEKNYERILAGLAQKGDRDSLRMAELMKKKKYQGKDKM